MRLATAAIGLACLATNAVAHPVTLHMAFIGEADDGLTRQGVDALGRPEAAHKPPPPPSGNPVEESPGTSPSPSSSDTHRIVAHHRRHHRHRSAAAHTAVAATPSPTPHRPWLMVKLVTFTHWWNGWSERNLHTTALDVHLDRPAPLDHKTA